MTAALYLDANATEPLRPEAREAAVRALDAGGNPSSVHAAGRAARRLLEDAREALADRFGVGAGEVVLTAMFLIVILGATHRNAAAGFAPIAIGLGLTLIHLISIPVTNTSVNPARSTGVALIAGGEPLSQLWLFWAAPIIGGVLGGVIYKWLGKD